jgi:hypothetical protein
MSEKEKEETNEADCEVLYDIDVEELLKTANIVGYVEERWNAFICLEKNGKHYVLLFSAEADSGNSIVVNLLGPYCNKAEKVDVSAGVFLDKNVEYWAGVISDVAKECWKKYKTVESVKEEKIGNETLLTLKYADGSGEVYSSDNYEWEVRKYIDIREKKSKKLINTKYIGSSDILENTIKESDE